MGIIDSNNIKTIISSCLPKIKEYIEQMKNNVSLKESDYIFILILLGQYLYAKYCNFGKRKGDIYIMYPENIDNAFADTIYCDYASGIVTVRNAVCHNYGFEETSILLKDIMSNSNKLMEFMEYVTKESSDKFSDAILEMNK